MPKIFVCGSEQTTQWLHGYWMDMTEVTNHLGFRLVRDEK